jgi:hypothetical protein
MRIRVLTLLASLSLLSGSMVLGSLPTAVGVPNPVATDEATYQAFGRVFPDPHGCQAYLASDADGDGVKDTPPGVSPWAKGRVCADQFLSYEEVLEGTSFLANRFPDFLKVIRLDQAFDNPNYMSAGIPRTAAFDDGKLQVLERDRRPLYMFKVTDRTSTVPESDRLHFAYSLSIHGIERAGVEGGVRAMEDLVTWAACEEDPASSPACAAEGPFPKPIVETPTDLAVPSAGQVLDNAVIYFLLPNPDGWARGQVAPAEFEDGAPNTNYSPGVFYQRYNGNGVDLNRDWPSVGYTFKPYSPGSEPETKAFAEVLKGIKENTSGDSFAGAIDLHGMITAYAFSYTLLGAGERDYRKNAVTVDTSIRTWQDQTQRLAWSPYVADKDADGEPETTCVRDPVLGGGTRGHVPACVADQWGTVIDTIGYQVTGAMGDWLDSPVVGLGAVGIDNEMYTSHIIPNTIFDPALEQTHIDGNKGLIYSQVSSLLAEQDITFQPTGKIGFVYNPDRLQVPAGERPSNPGLPAQNDVEVLLPCQGEVAQNLEGSCGEGEFVMEGDNPTFEFDVLGPAEGIWNGGLTLTITRTNVTGISDGNLGEVQLQHFDEGQWHTVASDFNQSFLYLQAGQIVTVNDPYPGRWRVWFELPSHLPSRVKLDFSPYTAEMSPGQAAIDASSMDFFESLNRYVPDGQDLQAIPIETVANDPAALGTFDTVVVVNNLGSLEYLRNELGLTSRTANGFFQGLGSFARNGGNLVLTDAALQALPRVHRQFAAGDISGDRDLVGNYNFRIGEGLVTYEDPGTYPLATDVDKPGAAEQEQGRRQAAEPTPLGYTPDPDYDPDPQMPYWGVNRHVWESRCGQPNCTVATTEPEGDLVNLGELRLGQGVIRVAGIMFPDPVFEPDEANDHRFGLGSYALTYTSYELFENLVNYRR